MFKFSISLINLFFLVPVVNMEPTPSQNFIRLDYMGETIKPFPVIYLFFPGSLDTAVKSYHGYKFEISKEIFENISVSVCKQNNFSKDSILKSPYRFTVIKEGETNIFLTTNLNRVKFIFQAIKNQLTYSNNQKVAEKLFEYIIIRLKYEIIK